MPGAQEYHHRHSSLKDFALPLLATVIELLVYGGPLYFIFARAEKQDGNEIGAADDPRYFRKDLIEAGLFLVGRGLEEVGDA